MLFVLLFFPAQGRPLKMILEQAIAQGDARKISFYFDRRVDVSLAQKTDTYSREQATWILQDFFKKVKPRHTKLDEAYTADKHAQYLHGILQTRNGRYEVFIMLSQVDDDYLIRSIRFVKRTAQAITPSS